MKLNGKTLINLALTTLEATAIVLGLTGHAGWWNVARFLMAVYFVIAALAVFGAAIHEQNGKPFVPPPRTMPRPWLVLDIALVFALAYSGHFVWAAVKLAGQLLADAMLEHKSSVPVKAEREDAE